MTAAFMWPGADEPIGECSGTTFFIDHGACRRQGIDPEQVRRRVEEILAERLLGMRSDQVPVSVMGEKAMLILRGTVKLDIN